MKKITLLLTVVFVLSAASLYAQDRVNRDGLSQLLHQMYFSVVPVNEFNQVFQNFLRSNYPGQNIFNAGEVREITSGFMLSFLDNEAIMDKWNAYADAANGKKSAQPQQQSQPTTQQPPITIVNNTGYTIYNVYISPSTSDSWGADRLGSDEILDKGASVSLPLPNPINVTNRYDIRLKDSDGDTYTKKNVLVAANSRIVFTFDDYDK